MQPNTIKKQPPRLLFFRHGEIATLTDRGDTIVIQRHNTPPITFNGTLAAALRDHFSDGNRTKQNQRLQLLARHHPALAAIEQAATSCNAYQQLVCDDLGMLFIELTLRCNERCLHCYAGSDPERSETLSCQQVKQLLDEARTMGDPRIQFTGGDPLIHPDLVALLAYAHSLHFSAIEIYTNGLLLHQSLLEQLAVYAPSFAFSIYSHRADHHDAITRVPGSHTRTTDAIRRVIAAHLPLRVSIIIMNQNRQDLDATKRWLIELGVDRTHIGHDGVRAIGRGVDHATGNQERDIHPLPPRKGKLCVSADGHIYPCIFSRNAHLGSIHHGSIRQQLTAITIEQPHTASHWTHCQQRLTCADCQLSAWILEKPPCLTPVNSPI